MSAAHALHGIALIGQGDAAAGVAEADKGLALLADDGARTCVPYYWSWQVRGRLLLGDVAGAAVALRTAEQIVADTAELWNRPFVLAAGAALAHAQGADRAEVDRLLDEAIAVATAQGMHGTASRLAADLREQGLLPA
jgi:hypothetical protein